MRRRQSGEPPARADERVRGARDRYLELNGFTTESYTAPTFTLKFLGVRLSLPNTKARQRAIPLHDLHHVATGYGTDFTGEAEIGAWELRAGCTSLITYYLNGMAVLIGLAIAPRRVLRAFSAARGHRTLYRQQAQLDELLVLTVGELRARVGVPREGQAHEPGGLHAGAPGLRGPA